MCSRVSSHFTATKCAPHEKVSLFSRFINHLQPIFPPLVQPPRNTSSHALSFLQHGFGAVERFEDELKSYFINKSNLYSLPSSNSSSSSILASARVPMRWGAFHHHVRDDSERSPLPVSFHTVVACAARPHDDEGNAKLFAIRRSSVRRC